MAAGRSFTDYVKRKCYGPFGAVENYIHENADRMYFRTSRVQ